MIILYNNIGLQISILDRIFKHQLRHNKKNDIIDREHLKFSGRIGEIAGTKHYACCCHGREYDRNKDRKKDHWQQEFACPGVHRERGEQRTNKNKPKCPEYNDQHKTRDIFDVITEKHNKNGYCGDLHKEHQYCIGSRCSGIYVAKVISNAVLMFLME